MTIARRLARRLIPGRTKRWIRKELSIAPRVPAPRIPTPRELEIKAVVNHLSGKVPINTIPSFAGDDLVSWHNPEFLADPAFIHREVPAVMGLIQPSACRRTYHR